MGKNVWVKCFWNREGIGIGVMGGINIAMYDLLRKEDENTSLQTFRWLQKEKLEFMQVMACLIIVNNF